MPQLAKKYRVDRPQRIRATGSCPNRVDRLLTRRVRGGDCEICSTSSEVDSATIVGHSLGGGESRCSSSTSIRTTAVGWILISSGGLGPGRRLDSAPACLRRGPELVMPVIAPTSGTSRRGTRAWMAEWARPTLAARC